MPNCIKAREHTGPIEATIDAAKQVGELAGPIRAFGHEVEVLNLHGAGKHHRVDAR